MYICIIIYSEKLYKLSSKLLMHMCCKLSFTPEIFKLLFARVYYQCAVAAAPATPSKATAVAVAAKKMIAQYNQCSLRD